MRFGIHGLRRGSVFNVRNLPDGTILGYRILEGIVSGNVPFYKLSQLAVSSHRSLREFAQPKNRVCASRREICLSE